MITDIEFRQVPCTAFFAFIGPRDIKPIIQPGRYPYTTHWLMPDGQVVGISIDTMYGMDKIYYIKNNVQ